VSDEPTTIDPAPRPRRSPRRWLLWGAVGLVALVALGYGAIFLYTEVINDPADELTTEDLVEALQDTTPDEPEPASTAREGTAAPTTSADASSTQPATAPATSTATGSTADSVDGTWTATDASELGYRVKEILFGVDAEGVGRTNQITGSIVIVGTQVTEGGFEVDVASIESDDSRRDNQFRGRIMSTDEFPTATFVLTEPIELGQIPDDGVQITTTATGDLTLRGVTNPVTFDVTAQRQGDRIGVLGNIPIVFADYEIANPSSGGVTTGDDGLLEFVLVFER
jgi:polyisoprenoid-binding protein YceI